MATEVRTPVFEGPFDLLLHLILRSEVDVYEVSLADVVTSYLEELERMEVFELESASEFLLIAATLIELKSRQLLPESEEPDDDEETDIWASRDRLLARLLECHTYRNASSVFEKMMQSAALSRPRAAGPEVSLIEILPDPLAGVSPRDIAEAYLKAAASASKPTLDLSFLSPITYQVPDAVADLKERLPGRGRVGFSEITESLSSRMEVVTHFLALLEMFRLDLVEIYQTETFGQITVEWKEAASSSASAASVTPAAELWTHQ